MGGGPARPGLRGPLVSAQTKQEARRALLSLYRERDGFDVSKRSERVVSKVRSSPMYGEIMPTATMRLLDYLDLKRKDVLYDLGSGVGKLIVYAAMTTEAKCVGIELVEPRHRLAVEALEEARRRGMIRARRAEMVQADFMRVDLSDATVIYTCSTAFPPPFMRRLARHLAQLRAGLTLVSLQDLDPNPWFEETDVLRLDMSWRRRAKVYVYRLVTPRRPK